MPCEESHQSPVLLSGAVVCVCSFSFSSSLRFLIMPSFLLHADVIRRICPHHCETTSACFVFPHTVRKSTHKEARWLYPAPNIRCFWCFVLQCYSPAPQYCCSPVFHFWCSPIFHTSFSPAFQNTFCGVPAAKVLALGRTRTTSSVASPRCLKSMS